MEVKNPQVAALCNNEVLELLKKTRENTKLLGGINHTTILFEVNKYLEERTCANQNSNQIREFLLKLKHMPPKLTKKEKIMLINDPPESVLQLSLSIKDFYDRLSEQEAEMLLKTSRHIFRGSEIDQELVEVKVKEEKDN